MKIKVKTIFVFFICICNFVVFGEVKYRVSGKVVCDGNGIANLEIEAHNVTDWNLGPGKIVITDNNGDFYFYVPNGTYELFIIDQKGYVSREKRIFITVKNKNIRNVIFFMEKGCIVSGVARFVDGTPIIGSVDVSNRRGSWTSYIDRTTGKYTITGIYGLDDSKIYFFVEEVKPVSMPITLQEGEQKEVNLILPKNISIKGKIIDTHSKEILFDCLIAITDKKSQFSTVQNELGFFYFYNLSPGKYYVFSMAKGYKYSEKELYLEENETKDIIIELEKENE